MQVDMVLAVNMPLHVPEPGHEWHSTPWSSSMSMLPGEKICDQRNPVIMLVRGKKIGQCWLVSGSSTHVERRGMAMQENAE